MRWWYAAGPPPCVPGTDDQMSRATASQEERASLTRRRVLTFECPERFILSHTHRHGLTRPHNPDFDPFSPAPYPPIDPPHPPPPLPSSSIPHLSLFLRHRHLHPLQHRPNNTPVTLLPHPLLRTTPRLPPPLHRLYPEISPPPYLPLDRLLHLRCLPPHRSIVPSSSPRSLLPPAETATVRPA